MAMTISSEKEEEESRLSEDEEASLGEFLEHVNAWRSSTGGGLEGPMDRETALKFLMARRFNVDRSLLLYQQHESMRIREGLRSIRPRKDPELEKELRSGKFTILPSRDEFGATLAVFHAQKHNPSAVSQRTTLQGVVYQLDAALMEPATQRGGLVFIYNMTGSKYSNFDYELSQKILTLLKGSYPARLKKVLIVTAPLWFKAPFKVLRLFVREKLRDRVYTVSNPQLVSHIPPEAIPEEMGGRLKTDHDTWLNHCQQTLEAREDLHSPGDEPTLEQLKTLPMRTSSVIEEASVGTLVDLGEPVLIPGEDNEDEEDIPRNGDVISSVSSGFSEEDLSHEETGGMDLLEFIEHVRAKGRRGLFEEYMEIRSRPLAGTFESSLQLVNRPKNRYSDVLCFDHTRVRLKEEIDGSDYINANFVDGYRQPKAFISTQGPLEHTFTAFWQMIWEQEVYVVVMTTKTMERHRPKCDQYWPEVEFTSMTCGKYEISSLEVGNCGDSIMTSLNLTNTETETDRLIYHFQFVSWPDYGVPTSAMSMLHFLKCVRNKQAKIMAERTAEPWNQTEPPIVVHCSAGIGRTGTFATLDYAIRKFIMTNKVDIRSIVEKIRSQRAFSIQVQDQYVFCHLAFLEFALKMDYIKKIDLTGFDDTAEESE